MLRGCILVPKRSWIKRTGSGIRTNGSFCRVWTRKAKTSSFQLVRLLAAQLSGNQQGRQPWPFTSRRKLRQ